MTHGKHILYSFPFFIIITEMGRTVHISSKIIAGRCEHEHVCMHWDEGKSTTALLPPVYNDFDTDKCNICH